MIVKPFWIFGIDRGVQNAVGSSEYGFYFSLFSFSILFNIILDFGITNFNNREISQNRDKLVKYLSNIVVFKFFLTIVYALVAFIIAYAFGYDSRQIYILSILIFNQILSSFILYFRSNISGLHFFKIDSILSVLDRFILILIVGLLLWGNIIDKPFKIEWFVYSQTISYTVTLLISFLFVLSKSGFFRLQYDVKFILKLLRKTYPYALLTLLMAVYFRIDIVFIERLLPDGEYEAGIYAQAFRLLDAFAMYAVMFSQLLLPMFSSMLKKDKPVGNLVQFSFLLMIVPIISMVIPVIFYRTEIMDLLYHQTTPESPQILAIMMLSLVAIANSYIFGTLLTANGNLKQLNIVAGFSMVLNIGLNLILIPKYKATGAALASLITQTISISIQFLLVRKKLCYCIFIRHFFQLIFFTFLLIVVGFLLKLASSGWISQFIIMVGFAVILALTLRIVNLKVLGEILKQED